MNDGSSAANGSGSRISTEPLQCALTECGWGLRRTKEAPSTWGPAPMSAAPDGFTGNGGLFYPTDLATSQWFDHYARTFDTVEINASFYSWPTAANVKSWRRQPGNREFVYTVKVSCSARRSARSLPVFSALLLPLLLDREACRFVRAL